MIKRKKEAKKASIEIDALSWWILAVAFFVLVLIGYLILSGKGLALIEKIKDLFRFKNP